MKTNINADWPSVDPGSFRHQITLLTPVQTLDESGTVISYQPTPALSAWARIDYLYGAELLKAGQDTSKVFIKLTSWYRPEFTSRNRVQLPDGSVYQIQYIENVKQMNTYMVLTCISVEGA